MTHDADARRAIYKLELRLENCEDRLGLPEECECGYRHKALSAFDVPLEKKPELSWDTLGKDVVLWVAEQFQAAELIHGVPGVLDYIARLRDFAEGRGEAPE